MAASLIMCVFIPIFGYMSDRIGRTKVYFWGSLITGFSAFPAFWMINTSSGNMTAIWLSIIIPFGIFYASIYGPEAALFCELFPARIRYSGISFVYQFSGIFASGLTPIIATAVYKLSGGSSDMIAAYVAFAGAVSALSAYWIRTRLGKQMRAEEVRAS
jgi:MFS family permease